MAKWQLLSDDVARKIWDETLLRFKDYTPFQTYAWGEYRRPLGWKPCYWAAFNENGEIVALMLGLLRRYPFKLGLVWSEGGPVGDLSECGDNLQDAMKQTTGLKRIYCRFRCDRERDIEDALRLTSLGWCRSWFKLTSNYSMKLNLSQGESAVLAGFDRNVRRNLRVASENNLVVRQWTDPTVDEILAVYQSMQSAKGLEEQYSREEIEHLWASLKQRIVLYRCEDASGQTLSLLGWIVLGSRAWALLSATSEAGRKLNASYAVLWALIQHGGRIHVESCDLAGIDPIRNHGVYRFKRATGAAPLEYLGEWDWATSSWLRWAGNWAISRRDRICRAESSIKGSVSVASKALLTQSVAGDKLPEPKTA